MNYTDKLLAKWRQELLDILEQEVDEADDEENEDEDDNNGRAD